MTEEGRRERWPGPDEEANPAPEDNRARGQERATRPFREKWDDVEWPATYGGRTPAFYPTQPEPEAPAAPDVSVVEATPVSSPIEAAPDGAPSQPDAIFHRRLSARQRKRLTTLSDAIALYPDTPSNYVLRGEVYLKLGKRALAAADFEKALTLAQMQFMGSDWGLVAQAVQDRAQRGLQKARRGGEE